MTQIKLTKNEIEKEIRKQLIEAQSVGFETCIMCIRDLANQAKDINKDAFCSLEALIDSLEKVKIKVYDFSQQDGSTYKLKEFKE